MRRFVVLVCALSLLASQVAVAQKKLIEFGWDRPSPAFVARWKGRIVNVHPSLLPAYKGLDTHARVLADGAAIHGCTVHLVTEALDEGEVLAREEVAVEPGDDAASLEARVLEAEHGLYPKTLSVFVRRA